MRRTTAMLTSDGRLPLAAAAQRLRRRPGRPRKRPTESIESTGPYSAPRPPAAHSVVGVANPGPAGNGASNAPVDGDCGSTVATARRPPVDFQAPLVPLSARLLDLPTAAAYLGVLLWAIRDLEAAGTLNRVRVPLPPDRRGRRRGGELRKLLYDRADLDRLIDMWKAASEAWMSRSLRAADVGVPPLVFPPHGVNWKGDD
jgi:hypothetical protein